MTCPVKLGQDKFQSCPIIKNIMGLKESEVERRFAQLAYNLMGSVFDPQRLGSALARVTKEAGFQDTTNARPLKGPSLDTFVGPGPGIWRRDLRRAELEAKKASIIEAYRLARIAFNNGENDMGYRLNRLAGTLARETYREYTD